MQLKLFATLFFPEVLGAVAEQWLAKCYNCLLETNLEITRIGYSTTNFADDMIFNESDGAVTYNAFKFGQYDNTWTNNSYIRCYEGSLPVTRVKNRFRDWVEAIRMHISDLDATARQGDALKAAVLREWMLEGENLELWRKAWLPA